MTPLRQRMIEDMQVRNFSPRTQATYQHQVARFACHFRRSPDALGPAELRAYQVYLTVEKRLAPNSILTAVAALRFLYRVTLKRAWPVADLLPAPKRPQTLPIVLSPTEVHRFLATVPSRKHRHGRRPCKCRCAGRLAVGPGRKQNGPLELGWLHRAVGVLGAQSTASWCPLVDGSEKGRPVQEDTTPAQEGKSRESGRGYCAPSRLVTQAHRAALLRGARAWAGVQGCTPGQVRGSGGDPVPRGAWPVHSSARATRAGAFGLQPALSSEPVDENSRSRNRRREEAAGSP